MDPPAGRLSEPPMVAQPRPRAGRWCSSRQWISRSGTTTPTAMS